MWRRSSEGRVVRGENGGLGESSVEGGTGGMWRWAKEEMRAESSLELDERVDGGGAEGWGVELAGGVGGVGFSFSFSLPFEPGTGRGKYFSRYWLSTFASICIVQ